MGVPIACEGGADHDGSGCRSHVKGVPIMVDRGVDRMRREPRSQPIVCPIAGDPRTHRSQMCRSHKEEGEWSTEGLTAGKSKTHMPRPCTFALRALCRHAHRRRRRVERRIRLGPRRRRASAIAVTGAIGKWYATHLRPRARPWPRQAAPVVREDQLTRTERCLRITEHEWFAYRRTGPGISTAVEVDGCADVQASGAGEIARSRHRARREGRIAKRRRAGILFDVDATLAHHATLRTAIRVRRTLKCVGAIALLADAGRSLKTARARFEIARRSKAVDHARLRDGREIGIRAPHHGRDGRHHYSHQTSWPRRARTVAHSKPRASSSCGSCDTMSEP